MSSMHPPHWPWSPWVQTARLSTASAAKAVRIDYHATNISPSRLLAFSLTRFKGIHVCSYSIAIAPITDTLMSLARRESERRLISFDPNVRINVEPDLIRLRERVEAIAALSHVI